MRRKKIIWLDEFYVMCVFFFIYIYIKDDFSNSHMTHLKNKNFSSRFVNIKITFGWIFRIYAGSSQEVYYIIRSIYISIIGCYLVDK